MQQLVQQNGVRTAGREVGLLINVGRTIQLNVDGRVFALGLVTPNVIGNAIRRRKICWSRISRCNAETKANANALHIFDAVVSLLCKVLGKRIRCVINCPLGSLRHSFAGQFFLYATILICRVVVSTIRANSGKDFSITLFGRLLRKRNILLGLAYLLNSFLSFRSTANCAFRLNPEVLSFSIPGVVGGKLICDDFDFAVDALDVSFISNFLFNAFDLTSHLLKLHLGFVVVVNGVLTLEGTDRVLDRFLCRLQIKVGIVMTVVEWQEVVKLTIGHAVTQ